MAHVLLVDPIPVAHRALQGILARGNHRLAAVTSAAAAHEFLEVNPVTDLVVMEIELEGPEDGLALLRTWRGDCFHRRVPVVIYTQGGSRDAVRQAMHLGVQNFLVKPYADAAVFGEVAKALAHPWRHGFFQGPPEGGAAEDQRHLRTALVKELELAVPDLLDLARLEDERGVVERLMALAARGARAGVPILVEFAGALRAAAGARQWADFVREVPRLGRLSLYCRSQHEPRWVSPGFASEEERQEAPDRPVRDLWLRAAAEARLPVVEREHLEKQVDALPAFPVVDTTAAAFQMAATGHPSSLAPLMDLVETDAGLSAQLLMTVNRMRPGADLADPVESARLAVGLLGEEKLAALARTIVVAESSVLQPPVLTWPQFRVFQLGVARLARYICSYLELESLEMAAYTAGLLHDLGKLLLLHLHPWGLSAVLQHARQHHQPVVVSERLFLQWTTREMAVRFAERHAFPRSCCAVLRHLEKPAEAGPDAELVAVVSLARELCLLNRVGSNGEVPPEHLPSLDRTPQWEVIRPRIFPSFNLMRFERQAHAMCRELRLEQAGRVVTEWE